MTGAMAPRTGEMTETAARIVYLLRREDETDSDSASSGFGRTEDSGATNTPRRSTTTTTTTTTATTTTETLLYQRKLTTGSVALMTRGKKAWPRSRGQTGSCFLTIFETCIRIF